MFRNLSKALKLETSLQVVFPFYFNAGFGYQRPSMMSEIPTDIIRGPFKKYREF